MSNNNEDQLVEVVKLKRKAIAVCLTCSLCNNILRNATTINECLHTFCRGCIRKKLSDIAYCPVCNLKLGVHPLESLRPDHNLQYIKTKIFPCKRIKMQELDIVPSLTLPKRKKEKPLSSLMLSPTRVQARSKMTRRRSKMIARTSLRGSSFPSQNIVKMWEHQHSPEHYPENSCSPETRIASQYSTIPPVEVEYGSHSATRFCPDWGLKIHDTINDINVCKELNEKSLLPRDVMLAESLSDQNIVDLTASALAKVHLWSVELSKRVAGSRDSLKRAEEKIDTLIAAQTEWASIKESYASTMSKQNDEITNLRNEVLKLKGDKSALEGDILQLNQDKEEMSSGMAQQRRQTEGWKKAAKEARAKFEACDVKRKAAESSNSRLQSEIDALLREKAELQTAFDGEARRAVLEYKKSQVLKDELIVLFQPLISYGFTLALDRAKTIWPAVDVAEASFKDFYSTKSQQAVFEARMADLQQGVDIIAKYPVRRSSTSTSSHQS